MSLHNTFANKSKPCYRCAKSVSKYTKDAGSTILGDFHLGWEYQLSYVESRVPKHLISTYFYLIE
jgi:hypothetical protein